VTNDILTAMDSRRNTVLILLDMSAAFDTVDHRILLQRLYYRFGIDGDILKWLDDYLSCRYFQTDIEGVLSSKFLMTCGVPQGSVLGPTLFTLYIDPIRDIVEKHNINLHMYADDLQLYATFKNDEEYEMVIKKMDICISELFNWLCTNKLKMNKDKTEVILIGQRTEGMPQELRLGAETHKIAKNVKDLGAILDLNMKMTKHINNTSATCFMHIRRLWKIRHLLTRESTKTLVQHTVISRLDYLNSLLVGLPSRELYKLQKVQNAAARLIYKLDRRTSITPFIKLLHWLPIKMRCQHKLLTIAFRTVNGEAPLYLGMLLNNYIPRRENLRSENQFLLEIPVTKTIYGRRSFGAMVPVLWNELPITVRQATTVKSFKRLLKTHLYRECFQLEE
jgi:hypothetical protein